MKFNLDSLVAEYEELEKKLSDPEIFKDQKKVKEFSSKKKAMQ
jgi:protein subunit release factor A